MILRPYHARRTPTHIGRPRQTGGDRPWMQLYVRRILSHSSYKTSLRWRDASGSATLRALSATQTRTMVSGSYYVRHPCSGAKQNTAKRPSHPNPRPQGGRTRHGWNDIKLCALGIPVGLTLNLGSRPGSLRGGRSELGTYSSVVKGA